MTFDIPRPMLRVGELASIAAGVLLIAGFALHPAGEDATFGTDPFWVPAHALLWAAYTISLLGWIALYIAQASKAGRLGVSRSSWSFSAPASRRGFSAAT